MVVEHAAEVHPELRFGQEGEFGLITKSPKGIVAPKIGEALEGEAFDTKQVSHAPDRGELHGDISFSETLESLKHRVKSQHVGEVLGMEEVFRSEAPGTLTPSCAVILNMATQILQVALLPEIDSALDLEVASIDGTSDIRTLVFLRVIMVDEEEGVSELVTF